MHDLLDLTLLSQLAQDPRASNATLAERSQLSRNTVHARMKRLAAEGAFLSFDRQISTARLGYPLHAWITMTVHQKHLDRIVDALTAIPEVVQASGLAGVSDALVLVACRDADHLFDVDARILEIPGVERTETALSMGDLIPYRVQPLIDRESRRPSNRVADASTKLASVRRDEDPSPQIDHRRREL